MNFVTTLTLIPEGPESTICYDLVEELLLKWFRKTSWKLDQNPLGGKPRRRRIGRTPLIGQPKLFGGSLEEYLEATNEEIPLVMKSCIRVINLYGLHHQGIYRVSGSQVEINNFRESFERGEDPLADVTDASDINSVAGVFKLYLRELREPLFPILFFDQFMELARKSIYKNRRTCSDRIAHAIFLRQSSLPRRISKLV